MVDFMIKLAISCNNYGFKTSVIYTATIDGYVVMYHVAAVEVQSWCIRDRVNDFDISLIKKKTIKV